ncbi:unnamed protein product [Boreogadus saida]
MEMVVLGVQSQAKELNHHAALREIKVADALCFSMRHLKQDRRMSSTRVLYFEAGTHLCFCSSTTVWMSQ